MSETGHLHDGDLLKAFAETGDEAAFAAIVQRHGAMVQGVCLRILGDFHEAQDVAQAVFLALARKAGRCCERNSFAAAWRWAARPR